ncbi:MAG: CHAT domain-containing protein, partial [Acidobacteriota bacterium]
RFETALGLFRQATDPLGEGSSLQSLGRLELERGRLSEAEAALRASAALREAQNDVERGGEVKTLLARVLLARYPEQEARLREALVLTEEALGGHRTYGSRESEAEDLWVRSRIHRALGELERALGDLEAAREISESLRVEVESPDLRAGMLSLKRTIYEDLVDLMIADGRSAEAFAVADQARARGLLDVLARAGSPGLSAHNRDARRAVIEGLAEARFRVSRASRRGEPAEDAVREAHRLSIELDRLIADSRVDAPRAEQAAVLSAGEVQGLLDPATALLAFSVGERRSFAWLLTPGSLRSSVLPGRKRLAAGAEELYRELSTFDPRRRQVRQLEQLSSLLLEPLAAGGLPPTVSRLVVVAEGPLLRLPFAALTLPEGSGDLLDRFEILYLPSCSLLPWLRERSRERGAPRLLAVVADPRFHQAGDGSARGPSSLPSSRQEAEALQRLSGGRADSWLGGRAAKKALEGSSLEPYRFVHFATHATLDSGRPELSSLSLALFDDEGRPLEGPLRLHDIYELRLQADLVVLSGCETALGRDVLGEGFLGLTRGFFFAGASRVAASLWRVEDRATAELMASFYRAMIDGGESPSAALRSAQLELRRRPRYRDPFFWAAFGVQGDWRTR